MNRIKYYKHSFVLLLLSTLPCMLIAQVMNISNGLHVIANGNISLVMDQAGMKNDGLFLPGNSTVYFSGAASTAICGSQPVNFYNLIFRGTGTKLNSGDASVIGTLGVEGPTVLDADGTLNDKPFTLRSSDTATASVDKLTTGNITGNVTVERFINTGTAAGQHTKSWQFLATPTMGQTIFQSWQEGGLIPAGYGTWITGTGTGFDVSTVLPSIKYYNEAVADWTGVTNTSNTLQNKAGYMIFVRGDRTVTAYNAIPNSTNMRSKGVLFTPANPPAAVPVAANRFQSFGNPYASRIEFNKVYAASSGINDVFYVWDPKLNGTYNLGGYQTLSAVTGYIPTAGSATTYYAAAVPSPFIESGQAVFVHGNGTGGNINFNENCKASGSRLVNKPATTVHGYSLSNRQFLYCSLFTNTGIIADGNIVAFENGLGNEINQYDADKMLNPGENIGINRNGKILGVEARDNISTSDTIFYTLQNLRQQPYQFRFAPVNISTGLIAYLIDRFNNTSTMISLADSSFIDFSITSDAGSSAADRFILVFQQPVIVPLFFVSIAAARNDDQTNQITWAVANEINLQEYIIERSADGATFHTIGHSSPLANNGAVASYSYRDKLPMTTVNFYRIKAISSNGQELYSPVVKIASPDAFPGITVYPNPVVNKTIFLNFKDQKPGNYTIQLSNKGGQLMYKNTMHIDQPDFVYTIKPGNVLAPGTYQLSVVDEVGNRLVKQVLVK